MGTALRFLWSGDSRPASTLSVQEGVWPFCRRKAFWGQGGYFPEELFLIGPSLTSSPCPQRLYYVREAHGIVVTDVAFLPEKGRGPELLGSHETALFSVAVDSRCQLHLLPSRRESLGWGYHPAFRYSRNLPPREWAVCSHLPLLEWNRLRVLFFRL